MRKQITNIITVWPNLKNVYICVTHIGTHNYKRKKTKCCSRKRPFSRPTLPGLFHKLKASEICKGHSGQNQSSKGRQKRHIGGCALKQGCQIPMRTHRKLWNFLRKKKNTLIHSNNILHFILGGAPSP